MGRRQDALDGAQAALAKEGISVLPVQASPQLCGRLSRPASTQHAVLGLQWLCSSRKLDCSALLAG